MSTIFFYSLVIAILIILLIILFRKTKNKEYRSLFTTTFILLVVILSSIREMSRSGEDGILFVPFIYLPGLFLIIYWGLKWGRISRMNQVKAT